MIINKKRFRGRKFSLKIFCVIGFLCLIPFGQVLVSCDSKVEKKGKSIRDDLGREVLTPGGLKNGVIGLSPALTEIICQVFPKEKILARTRSCDFPEWVLEKPEIESYPLDIESIISLKPELLFSEKGIIEPEIIKKLKEFGIETYIFQYEGPEDISRAMLKMGEIFPEIQGKVSESVREYSIKIKKLKREKNSGLTVLGLVWTDPIYVFGYNTVFTRELEWLGAKNVIDSVFSIPYPEISREYLLMIDPDLIFGISFEEFQVKLVKPHPELRNLKAYQNSKIFSLNHDLLTRPSPRIPVLLSQMDRLIYE
jgi:ABC-type Fe3+-hydroxamate transport system substrate-binding protein